jgi:prepilin-type N-terminal cleavage/methylation domain-containing protein
MKTKFMNKKGITLIELLIVIALLLIVLGIGYTLYFYAHNSFTNYEQRWIVQNEVRGVSRYLKNQVKTIYKCEILTAPPTKFNDENIYIWGEDNDIYIRYVDDNGKAITAVLNNEADLTIEFRRGTDSKGNVMNRLLQFEVSGASANYSLTNGVDLRNLGKNMVIEGAEKGPALEYRSVSVITEIPQLDYSTFCVVATASYGSYQEPGVMLLRRFRDEFLSRFELGRSFIRFYYDNGESVAKVIAKSDVLKFFTRLILYPVIAVAAMILNPVYAVCGYIILLCWLSLYIFMKKTFMRREIGYRL